MIILRDKESGDYYKTIAEFSKLANYPYQNLFCEIEYEDYIELYEFYKNNYGVKLIRIKNDFNQYYGNANLTVLEINSILPFTFSEIYTTSITPDKKALQISDAHEISLVLKEIEALPLNNLIEQKIKTKQKERLKTFDNDLIIKATLWEEPQYPGEYFEMNDYGDVSAALAGKYYYINGFTDSYDQGKLFKEDCLKLAKFADNAVWYSIGLFVVWVIVALFIPIYFYLSFYGEGWWLFSAILILSITYFVSIKELNKVSERLCYILSVYDKIEKNFFILNRKLNTKDQKPNSYIQAHNLEVKNLLIQVTKYSPTIMLIFGALLALLIGTISYAFLNPPNKNK